SPPLADDSPPAGDGIAVSHITASHMPTEPTASLVVPVARQKTAFPGKSLFTATKDPFLPGPSFSAVKNIAHSKPKQHPRLTVILKARQARLAVIKSAPPQTGTEKSAEAKAILAVSRVQPQLKPAPSVPVISKRRRKKPGVRPFAHTGQKQKFSKGDIPRLNNDFKAAVAARNYTKSSGIIIRIARLLGPKTIYVRKLQAFLYLRENKPAKAGGILRSILREDSTDLEAGLNMIVVLIKTGKVKAARQRARQLLDYYPGNRTLLHFKQQLGL
ncbi:MAG: tetratricopeptide repeat protein, partial [Deltaproteobacteria bacterium]|nr:tetratricopeptide repeat protein [Deltaproteobacteria bacterium]